MLLLIEVTLLYIYDQNENCTFIIYEDVRLFILLKRDRQGPEIFVEYCALNVHENYVKNTSFYR